MEHLDKECITLLSDILKGHQVIRFNMITTITAAWVKIVGWRKDYASSYRMCGFEDLLYQRYSTHTPGKSLEQRTKVGYCIRHAKEEWLFFVNPNTKAQLPIKEHLKNLGLGENLIPDLIKLTIEIPQFTTEKGTTCPPEVRDVWLYDPKGYFWPKGE